MKRGGGTGDSGIPFEYTAALSVGVRGKIALRLREGADTERGTSKWEPTVRQTPEKSGPPAGGSGGALISFPPPRLTVIRKRRAAGRVRAEVVDFAAPLIRRVLHARLPGADAIEVRRARTGVMTVIHRYRSTWNGRPIALPVAQLRARRGTLQLYWRHTTGRWVAYEGEDARPFVGGLADCAREISDDRWGCFFG